MTISAGTYGLVTQVTGRLPVLIVDANVLINLAKVGQLDLLLRSTSRNILILGEVRREATDSATNDPIRNSIAPIIDGWISRNEGSGVTFAPTIAANFPRDNVNPSYDAGERQIVEATAQLGAFMDVRIVSSDYTYFGGRNLVSGASGNTLGLVPFMNSLLLQGGITPQTYFSLKKLGQFHLNSVREPRAGGSFCLG
jgi:hypothetical protein